LDKSEFSLLKKREEEEKTEKEKTEKLKAEKLPAVSAAESEKPAEGKLDTTAKLPPALTFDLEGIDDRLQRLTPNSGNIRAAAMTPDGETLFYVVRTEDTYELWTHRVRIKEAKRMAIFPGAAQDKVDLQFDSKGESGFLLMSGAMYKFKVPKEDGDVKAERLKFNAEMRLDKVAERSYLFEHIWRQTREKLYVDGGPSTTGTTGHLRMAGKEVYRHAVAMVTDVMTDAFAATGYTADDLDWFVPHQANERIIDASAEKLGIAPHKIVKTVCEHGNTSAASIPLALAAACADGRIKTGNLVMIEAMGGGFTWGSALIRW
jgi:hypothetical protein